jgi:O-antigen ligase
VSARRRVARLVAVVALAAAGVATVATPAGAQQIIDAGGGNGEGGLAFIAFTIMCLLIVGSLFYMDRIRRRREEDARERGPQPPT